ncbi:potassium channel family protein [Metabacillus iocasae]|uniref:Voltage-gated potassium channel n=1 Tax=Priestia iocasae TaxID=2291674 RepID=A0ABS2QRG1_9BACI|nr:potassium channel family protein [Metabacillus iocasae]MBM7702029.1 voltage-gated potassium channel [Metabacillus iocasae]
MKIEGIKKFVFIYEFILFVLALISFVLTWSEEGRYHLLDTFVWITFVIDISVRFFSAPRKWEYIKRNPLDIIAVIPLDNVFQLSRVVRLIRALRLLIIIRRYALPVAQALNKYGLSKALSAVTILIFLTSIPIVHFEPSITNYSDAIWWSIVTATTVGYGDISPETLVGRFIAILLMLFGIGLIGMITGSITSYFLSEENNPDETTSYLTSQIKRIDELNKEEIDILIAILNEKKKKKELDH